MRTLQIGLRLLPELHHDGQSIHFYPLYSWIGPAPDYNRDFPATQNANAILHWNGSLSPGQEVASKAVTQAIKNKTELLVWAVCGAGKTEILFAGIEKALQLGYRICIAIPNRCLLEELAPAP